MTEKPIMMTPGNIVAIIEAIDAYLEPDASYVFLESEKTDLSILWQELKSILEGPA